MKTPPSPIRIKSAAPLLLAVLLTATGFTFSADSAGAPGRFTDFKTTGQTVRYGSKALVAAFINNRNAPTPFTYVNTDKNLVTMPSASSIEGDASLRTAGIGAGMFFPGESQTMASLRIVQTVGPSNMPPADILHIYATPFLNEMHGTYTEWEGDEPKSYKFTIDDTPGIALDVDPNP